MLIALWLANSHSSNIGKRFIIKTLKREIYQNYTFSPRFYSTMATVNVLQIYDVITRKDKYQVASTYNIDVILQLWK